METCIIKIEKKGKKEENLSFKPIVQKASHKQFERGAAVGINEEAAVGFCDEISASSGRYRRVVGDGGAKSRP